jgi:hypothetical protein
MLTVEYAVYAFMRKLANRYTGGYWGLAGVNYFFRWRALMAPAQETTLPHGLDSNGSRLDECRYGWHHGLPQHFRHLLSDRA